MKDKQSDSFPPLLVTQGFSVLPLSSLDDPASASPQVVFFLRLFVCMERVRRSEMHCLLSLWTWDLDSGWACTKHPYPTYSLSLLTSYSLMFLFFDHFDHAGLEFPFSLPTLLKCWSIPTIYSLSVLMFQLGTFLLNLRKPPKLCIV